MSTPPWKQTKPTAGASSTKTKLTPESIEWARARAKAAGRRYPNLVDNMAATTRQRESSQPDSGKLRP
ncbi:hypothetical protein [Rariglobus hedericola]|uniref:Uncharacterized protein n=1 Tax=Rariglobus hedericola TaxID=2597822 RepID=A0A556QSK7_9BACT|nr:hypothetical protein [Rariglobus hedericola]TSJ79621.1 hypothetical protein FPL22_10145 [Rariglobus hedericola]